MRIRNLLGALLASCAFAAVAAIPATEMTQAVEFYHSGLDHYFISTNPNEIGDLDTGVHPGWVRTGYRFQVIKIGSTHPGTTPVCRFYAPVVSTHFYSSKVSECDDVKTKFADTWTFEASEVYRAFVLDPLTGACPADTTPVYRLWNDRADVNHRYSDQIAVFQYMAAKGYKPEGDGNPALPAVFCTPAGESVVPAPAATAPNCTVTASTGTPALGTTLNLSAICTNSPTSYLWIGCTSTSSTCTPTQTTPGTKSYTLYASNAQGPAGPVTINVNWGGGGGGGGATPICTLTASAAALAAGTPLTLTANCNQSPNNYDWMECSYYSQSLCNMMPVCPATSSTCTVNKTSAGFSHYAIAASNNAGTGPRAAVDVEWTGGGGGGGGGGGAPDPIPVCNVLTSNAVPLVGTTVLLSASCSGNPTNYSWIGITCTQVQCGASSSVVGPVTYGVTAGNASGNSTAYVSVDWKAAPTPTPACTLTASNSTPLVGQTITISASCTNSPTSYAWTGCTSTGPNCTDSASVGGNKTYSLVASNSSGPGSAASVVVSWTALPTAPPVCSISTSNLTPTVGQNVTLTATCNGAPTSYAWTNCASTSSTCTTSAAAAGAVTYSVAGVNSFGPGNAAPVTVTWTANPPVCSVSASNSTPTAGQNITLTASCSGAPTSYVWTNCTSTSSTCITTQASAGAATYTVAGVNAFGTSNTASTTVNWQATGSGGSDFCGSYNNVVRFTVNPGDAGPWETSKLGGFKADGVIVMQFTVSPSSWTGGDSNLAEYQEPATYRHMTLSKSSCDFRGADPSGNNGPLKQSFGNQVGLSFGALVPGQTYYINWRNWGQYVNGGAGGVSCSGTTCNGRIYNHWTK